VDYSVTMSNYFSNCWWSWLFAEVQYSTVVGGLLVDIVVSFQINNTLLRDSFLFLIMRTVPEIQTEQR
jgi:hypothetical protein